MKRWKDIKDFEGLYRVSSDGDIYSVRSDILLKHAQTSAGYHMVSLCVDGNSKTFLVHRLVAIHFLQNDDDLPEVNHRNANKDDNQDWNLEWCTHQRNMRHSSEESLNPFSKKCCEVDGDGNIIKIYVSIRNCAYQYGIYFDPIVASCLGKTKWWKDIKFRYYDEENNMWIKTKFDDPDYTYRCTRKRKIVCMENGKIYNSQMHASRDLNIPQSGISKVLNGKKDECNGYCFEYTE